MSDEPSVLNSDSEPVVLLEEIYVEQNSAEPLESAPMEEPPAPMEEPPAPIEEPPAPMEEPPAPIEEPPAPMEEEHIQIVMEEPPAPIEEPPATMDEPPAPMEEEHIQIVMEEPPAPIEEPPAPMEEEHIQIVMEEPLVPMEEPPAPIVMEEPPAPMEEPPAPIVMEESPAPMEEPPAPIVMEESPAPIVMEESPAPMEEPPAPIVMEEPTKSNIPKCVFIVPYRDREEHHRIFSETMKTYLEENPQGSYRILYVHQKDRRGFNRGAMKNIGFIVVKQTYPNDYQNITLVFNDIDSIPAKDAAIKYETEPGVIKHWYGFYYALGGIVSVNARDFERLNGFPNFWAWGYEDNLLQNRAIAAGIKIDRSTFYPINDEHIIRLSEPLTRTINKSEFNRFLDKTTEGIYSIRGLNYNINNESGFVDVVSFETHVAEQVINRLEYDLRNGPAPFRNVVLNRPRRPTMSMNFF